MDELPSEARSVLELAKGAQEGADLATRQRVRTRVEGALLATGLLQGERSSTAAAKPLSGAKGFFTTTKIMLASSALLFGAGAALWSTSKPVASHSELPAQVEMAPLPATTPAAKVEARDSTREQNQAGEVIAPAANARSTQPLSPRRAAEVRPRALGHQASAASEHAHEHALAAEMSLLSTAADALAQDDLNKARSALNEHQRRFAHPQLREERDGLNLLARCMERPDGTQQQALTFVRKSPSSMLTARIKKACGLSDEG